MITMNTSQCLWSFCTTHGKRDKTLGRGCLQPDRLHQNLNLILQNIWQLIYPPLALCCQSILKLIHCWSSNNRLLRITSQQMPYHNPRCTRRLTDSVPRTNRYSTFLLSNPPQYLLLPRVWLNLQDFLDKRNRIIPVLVKKLLDYLLKSHFLA